MKSDETVASISADDSQTIRVSSSARITLGTEAEFPGCSDAGSHKRFPSFSDSPPPRLVLDSCSRCSWALAMYKTTRSVSSSFPRSVGCTVSPQMASKTLHSETPAPRSRLAKSPLMASVYESDARHWLQATASVTASASLAPWLT